jgi:hypothetical protein
MREGNTWLGMSSLVLPICQIGGLDAHPFDIRDMRQNDYYIIIYMDNIFSYLKESLIIGTTLVLFLVMAVAFRKIIKDVNDILDSTDKLVFFIAAFQCTI